MKILYRGGRIVYEITYNRKPYYFNKENNWIANIQEQAVINYIFSLPNRAEFEVLMEEAKPSPTILEIKENPKIIKKVGRPKKLKE